MDTAAKKHRIGRFFLSLEGFSSEYAEDFFTLKRIKKYARPNSMGVSHKEILSLLPFDAQVDRSLLPSGPKTHRLFSDRLSTHFALTRYRELLPEIYYALLTRDGERFIQSFGEDCGSGTDGIISLLRRKMSIVVRPSENRPDAEETVLSFDGERYFIDGRGADEAQLAAFVEALPDDTLICEDLPSAAGFTLRVAIENSGAPELLYAVLTRAEGEERN